MRDVICSYRPEVRAIRQRSINSETGEIKPIWGLVGIRLRTDLDDFTDDTDPVDPVPPDTGSGQKADNQALRSGDPVDSPKQLESAEENVPPPPESADIKVFSTLHRITG